MAKKKTKTERRKELSKIKKLLKKDEYQEQAVELLLALDDPEHWEAVSEFLEIAIDKHGFALVGNKDMHLLSHLPNELEGVEQKKRQIEQLRMRAGSTLIARAVPYVRRVVVHGRHGMPWPSLDELAKLEHLRELELWYLSLGTADSLEGLTGVTKIRISRNDIERIPPLPDVDDVWLEQLGAAPIGAMPKLRTIRISNSASLIDWSGIGASSCLESVQVVRESNIRDLDAIGDALAKGSPLREVLLHECPELTSIAGLSGAENLHSFRAQAPKLEDISVLASTVGLRTLELRNSGVRDVSVLSALEHLEVLDLTGCENVTGIEALQNHPSLRVVALGGTPCTPDDLGELLPWATWASTPHIASLAARVR